MSSVTLVVLTTGVFYAANSLSPESVLRKFIHQGKTYRSDMTIPSRSSDINNVLMRVTASLSGSRDLEIIRQERRGEYVLLVSRVKSPEGVPVDYGWVLVETSNGWRIDGEATVRSWAAQGSLFGSQ